MIDPEDNCV